MNQILENRTVNRTHSKMNSSFNEAVNEVKEKIVATGNLPHVSVEQQLELVDQLCEFPFGRYILERKGANGYWTDYLISYTKGSSSESRLPFLEDFVLNRSLLVLAHRERFRIYQNLMQKLLTENVVFASVPCGLMRDLLTLDFSNISNFKLVGMDIDEESLSLAKNFAKNLGIENIQLIQQDAWQIQLKDEFDVITSSGLNVYEPDPEKVIDLYRRFFTALKHGGSLIISVLTYPPGESRETDWNLEIIQPEDLRMEQILYKDILNLHWRNFRSSWELTEEFKKVGFEDITIHFDKYHMFPTIHARKPKL